MEPWLIDRLIDWFINWLIDWFINWLIDWSIYFFFFILFLFSITSLAFSFLFFISMRINYCHDRWPVCHWRVFTLTSTVIHMQEHSPAVTAPCNLQEATDPYDSFYMTLIRQDIKPNLLLKMWFHQIITKHGDNPLIPFKVYPVFITLNLI